MGFEVFEGKDKQHYFRFRAKNGEIQCHSEGYTTQNNAIRGAFHLTGNIIADKKEIKIVSK